MKKPLKIAQIAPIIERVPPKRYGGTERVVYTLTEELVKRGHDVTLFATADSVTSARLVSVCKSGLREEKTPDINEWRLLHVGTAYEMQSEFDIIHDHHGITSLPIANCCETPVIFTLHGPIMNQNLKLYEAFSNVNYVSISKSQVEDFPNINILANVYNGLNMEHYPKSEKSDGYLLFVGRISPLKGLHFAIDLAHILNRKLVIAAKLDDVDKKYYKEYIKPRLKLNNIKWVGEVDENTRNKLYSKAACLINPIRWEEPFGLTMIESMACGCPVVAFKKGSIPEIIVDGKTGFIVDNFSHMLDAVKKISKIKREDCRKHALSKFSGQKMADKYEDLYYKVLAASEGEEVIREELGFGSAFFRGT